MITGPLAAVLCISTRGWAAHYHTRMPVNVGVVGYNGIGKQHAGCHHEDDLATLMAVCDAVSERAQPAREQYGAAIYGSVPDMLAAHPELDIVDVCTGGAENGGWHFEPVMQALDAGKHVLVEKPLSNDLDEARQMVEFAAQRGRYLGCNLNHYFSEPADRAMDLVRDGKIGEQLYCLMRMGFQGGEYTYSGPDGNANSRGFPYFHVKAFLSHPFAIMRHFCGDITHVQAFMNRPAFRRAAGDPLVSVNSIHASPPTRSATCSASAATRAWATAAGGASSWAARAVRSRSRTAWRSSSTSRRRAPRAPPIRAPSLWAALPSRSF